MTHPAQIEAWCDDCEINPDAEAALREVIIETVRTVPTRGLVHFAEATIDVVREKLIRECGS